MVALARLAFNMSVAEFLAWTPQSTRLWQLVDGEPRMMSPPSVKHALVQSEIGGVIRDHLRSRIGSCRVYTTPGIIPRIHAGHNMRVPDLAVNCVPQTGDRPDLAEPLLVVDVLSPSNEADTWTTVRAHTTIPSVQEILVLRTDSIEAAVLRRDAAGAWPPEPEAVHEGDLALDSIALRTDLRALYRGTPLNPATA